MFTRWRYARVLAVGAALVLLGLTSVETAAASSTPHATVAKTASARKLLWSDEFNAKGITRPKAANWQTMTGGGGWATMSSSRTRRS